MPGLDRAQSVHHHPELQRRRPDERVAKGQSRGVVKLPDGKTLAVSERLGIHHGDAFLNVLENPRVGLMFVAPLRKEIVRVSGSTEVVMDADLLATMEENGRKPDLALLVRVEEAFFHCVQSMIRSRMWQPEQWGSIEGLPGYAQALKDHGELPDPLQDLERMTANNANHWLY